MIKIPYNRAVQLLEERIADLNKAGTDINAWKNRVIIDLQAIFGSGSSQVISVMGISTFYSSEPRLIAVKRTFEQTLRGYINFVKDFNIINQETVAISEAEYEEKYNDLLKRWNDLVPEYNKLLTDYEQVHKDKDALLAENRILKDKATDSIQISAVQRILFLGASPSDEVRLRIDEEVRDIETGLKMAALRDSFELRQKWAVTTKTLQQAMLDEAPHIVHFSGHGDIAGIALEDTLGNAKIIDSTALESLFELFSDSVTCVFLNSCYSESQALAIARHVPYVIGMKASVPDVAAIAFATGFYTALGAGKDIEFAFKMGLVSIKLEGVNGSEIPVLIG